MLEHVTISDIRMLQSAVPGAELEVDAEEGDSVPDSAEWEWRQGAQPLVRIQDHAD